MNYFIGIFCVLHGSVHLLYMGQGLKYFEIEKGFVWPDNSKLLANIFSMKTKRLIAGVLCAIAAMGFVLAGIFVLLNLPWQNQLIIVSVITSTILFIAFWDGSMSKLHTQGGIGILINILILVVSEAV